jgi:hypothetical protein
MRHIVSLLLLAQCMAGCVSPPGGDVFPTPDLTAVAAERREVRFMSEGVKLVGELALPHGSRPAPLAVIIHHSGPVGRDAYGYMAELLLPAGFAVFRFDKRGVGASGGSYGCCEEADALAAYRAAVIQPDVDPCRIFIIAQSRGTEHLAAHFGEYDAAAPPRGVALLSNLLGPDRIGVIAAPVQIIVSDSEPNLAAIGSDAAAAHRAQHPFGADVYVAAGSEHSLFDTSDGPIDWSDPAWVRRYHRGAMATLIAQLTAWSSTSGSCGVSLSSSTHHRVS